jgi:beta-ureidopropionase
MDLSRLGALVREAAVPGTDLVVLPELSTTPYFAGAPYDERYEAWAEHVPGPTTERIGALCRERDTAIAFGMLESSDDGHLYNSLVFLDRTGTLVPGRLADGRQAPAYRKVTAPKVTSPTLTVDEAAYCTPGPGPMVFDVDGVRYGALICYDRAFSEVWMGNRKLGADVVVAAVSSLGWREQLFVDDLRLRAMEFGVFVVASNRGGKERCGGIEQSYFGRSCVIAPDGEVLAEAEAHVQPAVVRAELDLTRVERARATWPVWDDRRPELFEFVYDL